MLYLLQKEVVQYEGYDLWLIEIDKRLTKQLHDMILALNTAGRRMACRNITKKFFVKFGLYVIK